MRQQILQEASQRQSRRVHASRRSANRQGDQSLGKVIGSGVELETLHAPGQSSLPTDTKGQLAHSVACLPEPPSSASPIHIHLPPAVSLASSPRHASISDACVQHAERESVPPKPRARITSSPRSVAVNKASTDSVGRTTVIDIDSNVTSSTEYQQHAERLKTVDARSHAGASVPPYHEFILQTSITDTSARSSSVSSFSICHEGSSAKVYPYLMGVFICM